MPLSKIFCAFINRSHNSSIPSLSTSDLMQAISLILFSLVRFFCFAISLKYFEIQNMKKSNMLYTGSFSCFLPILNHLSVVFSKILRSIEASTPSKWEISVIVSEPIPSSICNALETLPSDR